MTTQEATMDSVDQDQTAQNVQSDLWFTLSTFSIWIITKLFLHVFLANEKTSSYLFSTERVNLYPWCITPRKLLRD